MMMMMMMIQTHRYSQKKTKINFCYLGIRYAIGYWAVISVLKKILMFFQLLWRFVPPTPCSIISMYATALGTANGTPFSLVSLKQM